MELVCIGKIVNTHGIKGEVKIESYSDFDALRYRKGNTVYILKDGEYLPLKTASFRVHKGFSLVSFEGLGNINDVECYKQCEVWYEREAREPLKKGEYYRSELISLKVIGTAGEEIGTVTDVEETNGAQNNLRVALKEGGTVLIPYVPQFIADVDTEKGILTVQNTEGLL